MHLWTFWEIASFSWELHMKVFILIFSYFSNKFYVIFSPDILLCVFKLSKLLTFFIFIFTLFLSPILLILQVLFFSFLITVLLRELLLSNFKFLKMLLFNLIFLKMTLLWFKKDLLILTEQLFKDWTQLLSVFQVFKTYRLQDSFDFLQSLQCHWSYQTVFSYQLQEGSLKMVSCYPDLILTHAQITLNIIFPLHPIMGTPVLKDGLLEFKF